MENVYNHTSGIIKDPTVHRINVCESRSRPCTDAETRQFRWGKDIERPERNLTSVNRRSIRLCRTKSQFFNEASMLLREYNRDQFEIGLTQK